MLILFDYILKLGDLMWWIMNNVLPIKKIIKKRPDFHAPPTFHINKKKNNVILANTI